MIKKDIKYTDFNGKERTETHYFNLSKSELVRLQITAPNGDLTTHIQGLMDNVDRKEVMRHYDEIIDMSYGRRTEDGRFEKSPEIIARFKSSNAYDELFIQLFQDGNAMAEFVRGLLPEELQGSFNAQVSDTATANMTARERSEAQMQGFRAKATPQPSGVEVVKDAPRNEVETVQSPPVLQTAPPVLEPQDAAPAPAGTPTPEGATTPDISDEQLQNLLRQRGLNIPTQ